MINLIKKFLEFSLPVKIIFGSIFGIIAGPGLLGFISEYATYVYALRINIRPPLEGIPYLSATVAIASLVLSLVAVSIFMITRGLMNRMVNMFINYTNDMTHIFDELSLVKIKSKDIFNSSLQILKELPFKKAIIIIIILSATIALIFTGIIKIQTYFSREHFDNHFFIILFVYFFIVLLSLWRPIINWLIAISFALAFYVASFNILFNQSYYFNFLKTIKYGGDISITIEYKDNKRPSEEFSLLLRTQDYLFLRSINSQDISEISLQDIHSIKYK